MKKLFCFLIISSIVLTSFEQVNAQNAKTFATKEYYLVDSLVLEELSEPDKKLLEEALKLYHTAKDDTTKINALDQICENMTHDDWTKYQYFQYHFIKKTLATKYPPQIKNKLLASYASALNNIGFIHKSQGNFIQALSFINKSLKIHYKIAKQDGIANNLINIAEIYYEQGDIPKALEFYNKSVKILETIGDKKGLSIILNSIALIYKDQNEIDKSLELLEKSLKITEELGDKELIAQSYNNIGVIYKQQGKYSEAFKSYSKSLKIREELGLKREIAISLNNIGTLYDIQGDWKNAIVFFNKSLSIHTSIKNKKGISETLYNIGNSIYLKQNNSAKAMPYVQNSLKLSQELGSPNYISRSAELLSNIYEKQNKGMQALEMYKLHIQMRDSLNNEVTQKATAKQQAKYEYEKQKVLDDAENDKLIAIEKEAKEKQLVITYATGTGLGLVGIFLFFVVNRLQVTRKQKKIIEEQKKEVELQKAVVEKAHDLLEEKNQEILDSITYAKRIQNAILPPSKVVKEYLKESFILYKPKDIVAGDFYWMEPIKFPSERGFRGVLFAAADCTGHGVPGAMVSVVCNNALNRSVREHGLTDPGEILNKTREIVVQEFEKSDEDVKDGMDIALCSLKFTKEQSETQTIALLQYAGANNPLWIIRNNEIIETLANKQPIGKFDNPEPYTTHTFELQKGDSVYIFSDGYVDQFGGEQGKKFKAKAFRKLLLSIQEKGMEEQRTIIDVAFEIWKGSLDQIDDVCIIGVKI